MVAVGQYIENLLGGKGEPVVSVWEVLSAQECKKFGSHEGAILTVAFSPDDRRLASGSDDGTILYWRMVNESAVKDGDLTDDRLQALWKDLAGDAPNAVDAVWLLSARPKQVLPLLKANLRPVVLALGLGLGKSISVPDPIKTDNAPGRISVPLLETLPW